MREMNAASASIHYASNASYTRSNKLEVDLLLCYYDTSDTRKFLRNIRYPVAPSRNEKVITMYLL